MSELYINGKVVRNIQVNGYFTLNSFNIKSNSGIDTDSLCFYILNRIINYKGVKSINFITIESIMDGHYSSNSLLDYVIVIKANILTSCKRSYSINREYKFVADFCKIKSELREIKLRELI